MKRMEDKLKMIEEILMKIREEKKRFAEEQKEIKEKLDKEWKKKVEIKYRKEPEKREKLRKQALLSQYWEMLRWVTDFIHQNQEEWEKKKK